MKGITSNPALDAYQRMAVSQVGGPRPQAKPAAAEKETGSVSNQHIAKVSISSEARQMATAATQGALDPDKVTRIRADMDANQMEFDSTKVAERLVAALG
jgi:anti-sigma28 factor (negative regulator of flagellin synthesis)